MTNLFFDIPLREEKEVFNVVIEIPRGSRIKCEYDEHLGVMKVDRVFRTPVDYPQNYGFFPRTWNKFDNDPMDTIVISSESFSSGIMVPVRVIGMIEMEDDGELDHKILTVPVGHSDFSHCRDISDIDAEIIENIEWFLSRYKDRENKVIKVTGRVGHKSAMEFLSDCENEFKHKDF